jgi:hypothetical protein
MAGTLGELLAAWAKDDPEAVVVRAPRIRPDLDHRRGRSAASRIGPPAWPPSVLDRIGHGR